MITLRFTLLSVVLREAAEFRHYPLIALSVFYKCMFWYNSPGHKCDNSLLFWSCCFHSDNLYGPWFVLSRNVSLVIQIWRGLLILNGGMYQAFVHFDQCLKPINHSFWICGSRTTACIASFIYSYEALIKNSKSKKDKLNVQTRHKPHLFRNTQRCFHNYITRTFCHPVFPISCFWVQ